MPVEELMRQLTERASEIIASQGRLRDLLAANRSIVGELSLPRLQQRIVQAAREVVGARYAALGMLRADGSIDTLVHAGVDDATVAGIHDFPTGAGVLGTLAEYPAPARLDLATDPRAVGFPEGHPRMRSFLGVPVRADGVDYANLYLTEPLAGEEFTQQDEDLVAGLAATAGIAVENARLYEESRRRQSWLLASSEISQRLLTVTRREDEDQIWRLIAATVRRLADAEVVTMVRQTDEDVPQLRIVVGDGPGADDLEGRLIPTGATLAWRAVEENTRLVLASDEAGARPDFVPRSAAWMVLPLAGVRGARGALTIGRRPGQPDFTAADVDMAEDFAAQAAMAVELASSRSAQQRLGALEDRERIARDLHDHVIQRLFATGLTMQATVGTTINPEVRERLARTVDDLDETIRQIRTSIFALKYSRPTVTSVRATVLTAVDDAAPVLGFRPTTHLLGPVDSLADDELVADVALVLHEALANVLRHAQARSAAVTVEATPDELVVTVLDDGQGPGDQPLLAGLTTVQERADRRNGTLSVGRAEGGGTRLTWRVALG